VRWRGRVVKSAIWKKPLTGRVCVHRLNLEGDRQADPSLHGGHEKAVYVYPSEHYGENFTTQGLLEDEVRIGDQLCIGSVLLEVTQPRTPCVKLAMRFQRPAIVRRGRGGRRHHMG
jgi:MOSC domain-containing protein YiiM